jgi:hypothetical protein
MGIVDAGFHFFLFAVNLAMIKEFFDLMTPNVGEGPGT